MCACKLYQSTVTKLTMGLDVNLMKYDSIWLVITRGVFSIIQRQTYAQRSSTVGYALRERFLKNS